ncbi:urease accessory protein UreD [Propionivibrio sp.]|uniref:urease accessory protein UreD n=1 Tax=Propionivibrio sp. TaxID=2212460 RepID=UPI003BF1FD4F
MGFSSPLIRGARGVGVNSPSTTWHANLSLTFTRRDNATILTDRHHRGPLRVQKPLYPEGESVCQTILLHPPSGIAGGDQLQISASIGPQAHAQLTTPGAGKWYRSGGAEASQSIDFKVGVGAILEWLPQETIVFDGARARMQTLVELAADSRYLGWEILCLGRRAAGERFTYGNIGLHTRIERAGQPLWLERGQIAGDDAMLHSPAGWAGTTVCGTFLATLLPGDDLAALKTACRAISPTDGAEHGITALPGLLVARYLGQHSEAARHWFTALWQVLRPALLGRPAVPPRIWNT